MKTNITFGFISNYCYFQSTVLNGSYVSNFTISTQESLSRIYKPSANPYFGDLATLAAVNVINNSSEILPDIHINIKRFSDCGEWYPDVEDRYGGESGGFATAVTSTDFGINHNDVIAVIGNQYSTTALGPAQVSSLLKIPMCSGGSGSPRFSNKLIYPYFIRTLTSLGIGEHVFQFLKKLNVKRIAMIYQTGDTLAVSFHRDISGSMERHNIEIVATIRMSTQNADMLEYAAMILRMSRARYIFISELKESDYQQITWLSIYTMYDCVILLALGLDLLMKSNASFTPNHLATKQLQEYMDYRLFQKVSFDGVTVSPLKLNQYGDIDLPYQIFQYTGNETQRILGETAADGSSFSFYEKMTPVFFGGSEKPPSDGSIPIKLSNITSRTRTGAVIIAYIITGIIMIIFCIVFMLCCSSHTTVKRTSPYVLYTFIFGCILLMASLPFYIASPISILNHEIQSCLQFVGYGSLLAAVLAKMRVNYVLVMSGKKIASDFSIVNEFLFPLLANLVVEIVLSINWALNTKFTPTRVILKDESLVFFIKEKNEEFGVPYRILLVYNSLLLVAAIALAMVTRGAEGITGEYTFSSMITTTLAILPVVVIPVTTGNPNPVSIALFNATYVWILVLITLGSIFLPKISLVLSERCSAKITVLRAIMLPGRQSHAIFKTEKSMISNSSSQDRSVNGVPDRQGIRGGRHAPLKREVESQREKGELLGKLGDTQLLTMTMHGFVRFKSLGILCCQYRKRKTIMAQPWIKCEAFMLSLNGKSWIVQSDASNCFWFIVTTQSTWETFTAINQKSHLLFISDKFDLRHNRYKYVSIEFETVTEIAELQKAMTAIVDEPNAPKVEVNEIK
ncbi:periplasmic binding protein-like I [Obelidium mucronatum]|nr:periplasmic binding protein-like I [Obelidium mucronatum]